MLTIDQLTEICDDTFGAIRMDADGSVYSQRDLNGPWEFHGKLRNDQDSLIAQAIVDDCNEMLNS